MDIRRSTGSFRDETYKAEVFSGENPDYILRLAGYMYAVLSH